MTFPSEQDFALFLFQLFILLSAALVIAAIATSMMSGPLIQWAMGGRALFAKKALAKNDRGFEREGIAE